MDVNNLVSKYPLISDQIDIPSLTVLLNCLQKVLAANVEGDIVELGCYTGTSSLFIQRLVSNQAINRQLHIYDSFDGLPDKSQQDQSPAGLDFKAGELKATKQQLIQNFKKASLQLPIIHKAWFNDLTDADLPPKIAFAFLDGDFYDSILASLKLTWPKLSPGGIICIDDYKRDALPGVEKAVLDFFGPTKIITKNASLGILAK